MSGRVGLILISTAIVVFAVGALFLTMPREKVTEHATTDYPDAGNDSVGHVPKPSPAVPLKQSKPSAAPNTSIQPNSGIAATPAWPPDGMQFAAHHKGHKGCDGMLTLKASGLQFTCPGDNGKSFFVALSAIRSTDDDGIVTVTGDKYHFDKLPGGGKEYAEHLFSDWLARARPVQEPPR